MLYEQPETLTRERGETRIFAPISYAVVRKAQIAPVVHIEALPLAAWFPLCWELCGSKPRLVVIRSLLDDGRGQPAGSPNHLQSLPLSLRAYPFVVAPDGQDERDQPARIDSVIADQPTDVGAPILAADGRPGRGTRIRLQAVSAFNAAVRLTEAMSVELQRRKLLAPWPLHFDLGGHAIKIDRLLVVAPDAYDSSAVRRFIRSFGATGALFLGAHRLSLFRAGILLERARASVQSAATPA